MTGMMTGHVVARLGRRISVSFSHLPTVRLPSDDLSRDRAYRIKVKSMME